MFAGIFLFTPSNERENTGKTGGESTQKPFFSSVHIFNKVVGFAMQCGQFLVAAYIT